MKLGVGGILDLNTVACILMLSSTVQAHDCGACLMLRVADT